DVWSLGLIAFQLLTGTSYWLEGARGVSAPEAYEDVLEPASVRARRKRASAALPARFDAWFAACVHPRPARRYRNVAHAVADLCLAHDVENWSRPWIPRAFSDLSAAAPPPEGEFQLSEWPDVFRAKLPAPVT